MDTNTSTEIITFITDQLATGDAFLAEQYGQDMVNLARTDRDECIRQLTARATGNQITEDEVTEEFQTSIAFKATTAQLVIAQEDVKALAAQRADQLRSIVTATGSQRAAAKLLGINQSTVSRILAGRY